MSIDIITPFQLNANQPLDVRTRVADQAARLALSWPSRGLMVFQEATSGDGADQTYQYIGDETTNLVGDWVLYTGVGATGPTGAAGSNGAAGADGDTYATTSVTAVDITAAPTTVALTLAATTLDYTPGQDVVVASAADPLVDYFTATVTSLVSDVLNLGSIVYAGTASHTDWSVNLTGASGTAGVVGIALIHTEADITFTDTPTTGTVDVVEAGSWTPEAPWSASVFNDTRGNLTVPINEGSMTDHSISYDGTTWYNNGIWRGPAGSTGATGATGSQGIQGIQGDTGAQGPQGLIGLQGAQGPIGNTGSQGATGSQGPQGAVGPQGSVGATGASALSGVIPPTGGVGVNGDTYIDTVTGLTYTKAAGVWTLDGGDLTGPQGIPGPATTVYENTYTNINGTLTAHLDDAVIHNVIAAADGATTTVTLPNITTGGMSDDYTIHISGWIKFGNELTIIGVNGSNIYGSFLPNSSISAGTVSQIPLSPYINPGLSTGEKSAFSITITKGAGNNWNVTGGVSPPKIPTVSGGFVFNTASTSGKFGPLVITATNPSTGRYIITHNAGDTSYNVGVTVAEASRIAYSVSRSSNTCEVKTTNTSGTLTNGSFYIQILKY